LLEPEEGFGSGLRGQIERRHREGRPGAPPDGSFAGEATEQVEPETDELPDALLEQAWQARRTEGAMSVSARETGIAFLTVADRARRHSEARRSALPERGR
jgi:hypothetical protein